MNAAIIVELACVPALIAVNAFLVAAEYSIINIRSSRIEELKREGFGVARILERLKRDIASVLAAVQVCITATNLLIGAVAEPSMTSVIVWLLRPLGMVLSPTAARALGWVLGLGIVTVLTVTWSELLPKAMSLQYTDRVAMWVARPLAVCERVCRPIAGFLNWMADWTARLLGLGGVKIEEPVHSEQELEILVDQADDAGEFHEEHGEMLRRAFDFADLDVRHVMIPMEAAGVVPSNLTLAELAMKLNDRPYTRWVLRDPATGRVNGIINVKMALYAMVRDAGEAVILLDLAVEPTFLEADLPLLDALAQMRKMRRHLCIVREGNVELGIVTLEDILESIVGRVPSELLRPALKGIRPIRTPPKPQAR